MRFFKGIFIVLLLFLVGCSTITNEKKYTVEFFLGEELFFSSEVLENEKFSYPSDPVKEGYTFIGWDKEIKEVVNNMKVYAMFEINYYEVDFLVDGKVIANELVNYLEDTPAPSNPIKEGYTFIGWDKDYNKVKENLKVNAIFKANTYKVDFLVDEKILKSEEVEYLGSLEYPSDPIKEGYIFVGWDKKIEQVVEDVKITAIFEKDYSMEKEKATLITKKLEENFAKLEYPLVTSTIDLVEEVDGASISWKSSNENIINIPSKRVIQPFSEKKIEEVILEATITIGEYKTVSKFNLTVKRGYKDLKKGINAIYNYGSSYLSDAALRTYDIVYYAFLGLKQDGSGDLSTSVGTVKSNIKGYKDKLHKEGGRVLVSLVANSGTAPDNIRKVADNEKALENLVNQLLKLCEENDYDGIDVDWETPGDGGGGAYTKLMKKIYETFKAANPEYLVTSAIGAGPWQYVRYNLEESAKYHDYINMMSYDMQGGGLSSFQNALYSKTKATAGLCSIDDTVTLYNNVGVSNSQMIVGVPFYGRVFGSSNGLGTSCSGNTAINQERISSYLNSGKYQYYFDEDCKVPYLYNESTKEFVTYENSESIMYKWQYIKENNLAGMMSWQLRQDYKDKLTLAMRSGKNMYGGK